MTSLREDISRRASYLIVGIGVLFVVVVLKFGYVMLLSDPSTPVPENPQSVSSRPEAPRGKIVGARGSILATSIQRKSLYGNPRQIEDPWTVARRLAPHLGRPAPALYKRLSQDRYFVWLERKLSTSLYRKLKSLDVDGVGFVPEYERVYPHESLAGQVLGFVGIDNQGLQGVENQYDRILSTGVDGKPYQPVDESSGSGNFRLRLTLNQTIQHIAEDELARMARREKPRSAMVVVMDPRTGGVKAMAHWPTFNPNQFWEYEKSRRRNRIVSDVFEPGSTLKVMTIAIGLAKDAFQPSSRHTCKGYIYLPQARHTLHCYANHGTLAIPEILIKSCNVGMVKATQSIPPNTYYRSLRSFGFGTPTGIQLPGESSGILKRPSNWSTLTQSTMAIGHGLSTTALQLTSALGAVVNGGTLMRPRLVEALRTVEGELRTREPFPVRRVIPTGVASKLKNYMRAVVSRGTGKGADSERFKLAGKTGTAQKANLEKGGYYQDKVLASFIGFGPTPDPELVVGVFVDEPSVNRYGGDVAAPVFRRIMERSLAYQNQQDEDMTVVRPHPGASGSRLARD